MNISYAITVCNELEEVKRLINFLLSHKREQDEIVVLADSPKMSQQLQDQLYKFSSANWIKLIESQFEGHFADWKNKLSKVCSGDYIFQIDADEYPNEYLIESLPEILEANPTVEVYVVPRVNTVEGLTQEHITKWGWNVNSEGWVNWPDYQWRIYKNTPEIKWVNKVHEVIQGYKTMAQIPAYEDMALYHPKTIERQEKQNNYYADLEKNKLTIYNTCWGDYALHTYASDLEKSLQQIANTKLLTGDYQMFKEMYVNNLEGSALVVERGDGKFVILDWGDSYEVNQGIIKLEKHPDCLGYYSSQPSDFINKNKTFMPHLEFKYEGFNKKYTNHYRKSFDQLENKIYFSGEITDIRIANNKFLRTEQYKDHPEFMVLPKIDFNQYLQDIFKYKAIYSPAGGGDFAHRDFETFALGIPVIRQKYRSTTTTLQAGVHYIDIDSVEDFKELLSNKELLCTVGENGRQWYEQNCLYPGNVDEVKQLIKNILL